MYKKQEIVDLVANHLRTQGCQSRRKDNEITMCLYRSPQGRSCGIGCLVSDEKYNPDWETKAISDIWHDVEDLFPRGSLAFMMSIQRLHDKVINWTDNGFSPHGEATLKRICNKYELTYPEPQ